MGPHTRRNILVLASISETQEPMTFNSNLKFLGAVLAVCEPVPSILEELSYYPSPDTNVYKATGAMTYEECEQTKEENNTLWLGPDHSPDVGFVIDLGCSYQFKTVVLRNAYNQHGRYVSVIPYIL